MGGEELSCRCRGTRDKEREALPQQPAMVNCSDSKIKVVIQLMLLMQVMTVNKINHTRLNASIAFIRQFKILIYYITKSKDTCMFNMKHFHVNIVGES